VFIVPLLFYVLFFQKFRVKNFESQIEIPYLSEFTLQEGNICYGSILNCKSVEVSLDSSVDTSMIGTQTITYRYQFEDNTLEKTQIVKVVDNEAPSISVLDSEFYYCPNGKVTPYKVTAMDNYDGDVSSNVTQFSQDGFIIFSVTDSFGNEAILKKEAKELDNESPNLVLNGDENVYLPLYGTYNELGASAMDNCDGDLKDNIVIEGTVDSGKIGEYEITYSVKDTFGNESKKIRHVFVYENKNYEAPSGKTIYLTFDDGPGPYTEQLLNVLKKYNVKATFFVTNQSLTRNYDSIILRAYQEGHTIGLHSNSHDYGIYQNETTYFNDLYAIQDKVKRITGMTSMIIRFPGGSSNTISKNYDNGSHIMSRLTKAVEAKGFRYFDWNVVSGDAGGTTNTSQIVANVISGIGDKKVAMVLQHDIKGYSVNAVENIIQYGISHGYQFRAITMDTPNVHHHVNN